MTDIASTPRPHSGRNALGAILVAVLGVASYFVYADSASHPAGYGALSNYVFVQSLGAPEIAVIDTSGDTLAGTITLPVQPDQVVVSKVLDRILLSNRTAQAVSVYDLATQTIEVTIPLTLTPDEIVLSPDGLLLAAIDRAAGKVGIVDPGNDAVRAVISGFDQPSHVAFSDDSARVLVTLGRSGQVAIIDADAGVRIDPINISLKSDAAEYPGISAVTRTPNGLYGLLTDRLTGAVSVIDFGNGQEIAALDAGPGASRPYGTADGRYMMIASNTDRTVTVLSANGFVAEAVLPGLSDVISIPTGYLETLAYVIGAADEKAVIIDLEAMKTVGEIDLGGTPGPAVVDADGKRLYVALSDTNELLVIDVAGGTILKRISGVGNRPYGVNLAATNNYCH